MLASTNVLAAEVSPDNRFSTVSFDAALALNYVRPPEMDPLADVFLRYSNHGPTELRLYWTNGTGYALEHVDRLGEQWCELPPPSTNVIVDKNTRARFYRLNKRH